MSVGTWHLLQLAALKHRIDIGPHFDRLSLVSAADLNTILADPLVNDVVVVAPLHGRRSRPSTRGTTMTGSEVPDGERPRVVWGGWSSAPDD